MSNYRMEWADSGSLELRWQYDFPAGSDEFAIEIAKAHLKRMKQCDGFVLWANPEELHPRYVAMLKRVDNPQVLLLQSEGPY